MLARPAEGILSVSQIKTVIAFLPHFALSIHFSPIRET